MDFTFWINMENLKERLAQYIGGQMEVINHRDGYGYKGEIADIIVDDKKIRVKFAWLADNKTKPWSGKSRWVKRDCVDYVARLDMYEITEAPALGTIILFHEPSEEETTLFEPNNRSEFYLDPSWVEGLESRF